VSVCAARLLDLQRRATDAKYTDSHIDSPCRGSRTARPLVTCPVQPISVFRGGATVTAWAWTVLRRNLAGRSSARLTILALSDTLLQLAGRP